MVRKDIKTTIFFLTICVVFCYAGLVEARHMDLGDIIVTARRIPLGLKEIAETVTVMNAQEISRLPARTLGEALRYMPGVDIDTRSGFGQPASITIQGSESRQVRVMIDGIPLNSQVSEQVDPGWLPLENIERIEVIKGGASSFWGSGLGGVINIITKDTGITARPQGTATTSWAEYRTRAQSLDLSGAAGKFGYYIFSSYTDTAGKDAKADVREKKSFAKVTCDLEGGERILASFGYSAADANSGLYPDGTWMSQPYRIRYGKVSWQGDIAGAAVQAEAKNTHKDLITRTYISEGDEIPFMTVRSKDVFYQMSLTASKQVQGDDLLVSGMDLDWNTIKSDMYLSNAAKVDSQAVFANYTWKAEHADISAAARYDHNSVFGEEISPSLGAVYRPGIRSDFLVRARVSRTFTTPLLLWRYNANPLFKIIPNPFLGAEQAWVYELGTEIKPTSNSRLTGNVYLAEIKDAIAWASNESGEQYKANFEKFRRQGIELGYSIDVSRRLRFSVSGAFNDIENRQTGETVRGGGRPRQSFDLSTEYRDENGWAIILSGYYDRWNEPPTSFPNDRKMLWDLKISRDIKNLTVFFMIHNLADSSYWADEYFPAPRRYYEGGITLHW